MRTRKPRPVPDIETSLARIARSLSAIEEHLVGIPLPEPEPTGFSWAASVGAAQATAPPRLLPNTGPPRQPIDIGRFVSVSQPGSGQAEEA